MNPRKASALVLSALLLLSACNRKSNSTSAEDTKAAATASSPPASSGPSASNTPMPAPAAAPSPAPPPPKPKPIVIPAGSVLTVRLQQPVGSKISKSGERFQATLAEPVVINGKTVAPGGSNASGTVIEAHPAGRFKGGATLNVVLDTIAIRGNTYRIKTMAVSQESKGKGKRTATMVGGGAGAGALIGGLAGGGKGAAIGALVGAGAGTAGAGLTGKRDITLPAEAALSFQLTDALTLRPGSSGGTSEAANAENQQ